MIRAQRSPESLRGTWDRVAAAAKMDPARRREAGQRGGSSPKRRRIPETYQWLLVPTQDPTGPTEWDELRVQGDGALVVRASRRLRNDGLLYVEYAPTLLRHELDRIPLWRGDHVGEKLLWDDFSRYLYLPRLRDTDVLLAAIQQGVARLTWESETFAYAEGWDAARERYVGLRTGSGGSVTLDGSSILVKPEAARRQIDADEAAAARPGDGASSGVPTGLTDEGCVRDGAGIYAAETATGGPTLAPPAPAAPRPRRFHGTAPLKPLTISSEAGKIAEHVVAHLLGQIGAQVEVTVEIHVTLPDGAPDDLVRTVTENCATLKFTDYGFEEE